jgi:hypothetical protein
VVEERSNLGVRVVARLAVEPHGRQGAVERLALRGEDVKEKRDREHP